MTPVRTARSNMVLTGPPDVADLHAMAALDEYGHDAIASVWTLSAADRAAIAAGANVQLVVYGSMHPPVALSVTDEQGVGEDDPVVRQRLNQWATGCG